MRIVFKNSIPICILSFCLGPAFAVGAEKLIDLSSPVVATIGDIAFRECVVEAQARDRTVQCAWYDVPEDYTAPQGKHIKLFIARLPARKSKKILEPILFLAGGPGQSATASYLHVDRIFKGLAKDRDFYLVDQRGTGHSNYLGCGDAVNEEIAALTQFDPKLLKDLTKRCLQELPGDSRFYTTSVAIKDFEKIREALNVEQWNLFGVSYGTRSGIHYMRKHPNFIRTALLDSVVPPELAIFSDVALNSQKILSGLYQRCEQDVECNKRFPDLAGEVETLFF